MATVVERISTAVRSRSRAPGNSCGSSSLGLRDHGEVAFLDSHSVDRARDLQSRSESLSGYFVLSALLSPLDPEPKQLAECLLTRFGSISAITEASEQDLRQVSHSNGEWIESFIGVRNLIRLGLEERVLRSKLDSLGNDLHRYLLTSMRSLRIERMVAIFADQERQIISHEVIGEGREGCLQLSLRHLFARALTLNAHWLVLAHNHPSGSARPSQQDVENTKRVKLQAMSLGITLDDHLIVGRQNVTSMRQRGLL